MTKERLEEIKATKEAHKKLLKDKEFKNISTTEKWVLVETMAKMMGLIK